MKHFFVALIAPSSVAVCLAQNDPHCNPFAYLGFCDQHFPGNGQQEVQCMNLISTVCDEKPAGKKCIDDNENAGYDVSAFCTICGGNGNSVQCRSDCIRDIENICNQLN